MRKVIPCYGRCEGVLTVNGKNAYIKDRKGEITWVYTGKQAGRINVVACPRSGTVYTTEVLKRMGYDIGHEKMGSDGSVGYHLSVVRPENCLHQVRHPLKQIASMLAHKNWGFAAQIVDAKNHRLEGCMQLWLEMNEMCEEFTVWRYRLEDLPNVWNEFCERIGHKKCVIPDVPSNTNTDIRTKELTWDDLYKCEEKLAHDIYNKSLEYGYAPSGQSVSYQGTLVA